MIITLTHLKSMPIAKGMNGYCNKGARQFFERHNMDWNHFRKHGLDEQVFLNTHDAMAIDLVEHARGRK